MEYDCKKKICVVTVTYGNRISFLNEVIEFLNLQIYHPEFLIIVNNGSVVDHLSSCKASFIKIKTINLEKNTGSANGFLVGIQSALTMNIDYIWLLDDDNRPEPDALQQLISSHKALNYSGNIALLSTRIVGGQYRKVRNDIKPGDFLGFNIKTFFSNLSSYKPKKKDSPITDLRKIQTAPYGGLLMPKELLQKVGLPNSDFVSYEDDIEFSSRIADHNGIIYQCSKSIIKDIDISWSIKRDRINILISEQSTPYRLYYSVRNRCYLEYRRADNKMLFILNATIKLLSIAINALIYSKNKIKTIQKFIIIKNACIDGIKGSLGQRKDYENL